MPVAFLDLAEHCAPMTEPAALAAVVSLESRFNPLQIRVVSGKQLKRQPTNKSEAVAIAAQLMDEGAQLALGLGGISDGVIRKQGLSLDDVFEGCSNLSITGRLLSGYMRGSVKGQDGSWKIAFARYFGEGDAEAGVIAGYDRQAMAAMSTLAGKLDTLTLQNAAPDAHAPSIKGAAEQVRPAEARPAAPVPSWDVYRAGARAGSSILVFPSQ
ncbi:MAG: hypothetical protein AB7D33_03445 [Sphingobium sp.]